MTNSEASYKTSNLIKMTRMKDKSKNDTSHPHFEILQMVHQEMAVVERVLYRHVFTVLYEVLMQHI